MSNLVIFGLGTDNDGSILAKAGFVDVDDIVSEDLSVLPRFKKMLTNSNNKLTNTYLVQFGDDEKLFNKILDLATIHNQETVMLVDSKRECQIVELKNNQPKYVGSLIQVDEDVASMNGSWVMDKGNNCYYITKVLS